MSLTPTPPLGTHPNSRSTNTAQLLVIGEYDTEANAAFSYDTSGKEPAPVQRALATLKPFMTSAPVRHAGETVYEGIFSGAKAKNAGSVGALSARFVPIIEGKLETVRIVSLS